MLAWHECAGWGGQSLWRNVIGGLLAMAVTYGIGTLVGHAV